MAVGIRGSTISSSGGLLPPSLLERVRAMDRKLPGFTEEAYHLDRNQKFGEVTAQAWKRLLTAWTSFRSELATTADFDPATTITRERFLLPLFDALGYGRLPSARAIELDGKLYAITHGWGDTPIHLVGANVSLDRRTANVRGAAGQSPHGLVQELLNKSDAHLWGIVSNGRELRVLRDNSSLTRLAYLEFDLEAMFEGENYADFALLWLVCHQSRLEGTPPESTLLEQWQQVATTEGARALDRLRDGVEAAIATLGRGYLAYPRNHALRDAVRSGALSDRDYYRELLRLIYRLIFLFVAEDRDALLHPDADATARDRFQRYYSTAALRRLARDRRGTTHPDLWRSLRTVIGALGSRDGAPALGLPALGGFLFGTTACPNLDGSDIANRDLLEAIRALALVREGTVRVAVDYRNLGSEELGSIYESLLAYHPELHPDAATFELKSAAGNERKTTGSYYTPTSLINELLDSALEPVLDEAVRKKTPGEAEVAILALKVVDPAVGSGHFLVAAGHRIAKRLAAARTGDDEPSPIAQRTALRDVVARCLYGVDLNPDAAELCRVGLWLEALDPGRPLSFLDAHIRVGNSLLGTTPALLMAGIPDEAYAALEGDDKNVVAGLRKANKEERAGQLGLNETQLNEIDRWISDEAAAIDLLPDSAVGDVEAKAARYGELVGSPAYLDAKLLADAWCAAFVSEKYRNGPDITTGTLRRIARNPASLKSTERASVERAARTYAFFHWQLEFPGIFRVPDAGRGAENEATAWSGGFDVVLGNPPWERLKLQEEEFFAVSRPDISAAANASARKKMIVALETGDRPLFDAYRTALRAADGASHFIRNSNRYPLGGRGDVNTYVAFTELNRSLLAPAGRAGIIVPSGIATDDTTKFLFRDLVDRRSLVSLFDFENRERIFPGIDSRIKFCLLTLAGTARPADKAEFVFFALSTADLRDPDRQFTLTPSEIAFLNPNSRTSPVFRYRRDAVLTRAIYRRVPVLVRDLGETGTEVNSWGLKYTEMFHSAHDSGHFLPPDTPPDPKDPLLPYYEAKQMFHFDHRWASYRDGKLVEPDKEDPTDIARGSHLVHQSVVRRRLSGRWDRAWRLAWRDITSSTNERTVVAAIIPEVVTSDKLPVGALADGVPPDALVATLTSFVVDYVARQKMGGTLKFHVVKQLPVLAPSSFGMRHPVAGGLPIGDWIRPRVLELSYQAWDLQPFARDLGWDGPPFRWNAERRFMMRCELDALFFHLYMPAGPGGGWIRTLDESGDEFEALLAHFPSPRHAVLHVLDSFPIVRRKDEAACAGRFRTRDAIVDIYDLMQHSIDTGTSYASGIVPPPAHPSLAHVDSQRLAVGGTWTPTEPRARTPQRGSTGQMTLTTPADDLDVDQASRLAGQWDWVPEANVDPASVVAGSKVRHRVFGEGTVRSVSGTGAIALSIRFKDKTRDVACGYGQLWIWARSSTEAE